MQYTEKLGLKLPESTDNYNIDDFNYNSLKLDNMKNAELINKYLTPSVEKVDSENEKEYSNNILPIDITPSWSNNASVTGDVVMNLTSYDGINPTLTMKNTVGKFTATDTLGTSSYKINIGTHINQVYNNTSSYFLSNISSITYDANNYNRIAFYSGEQNSVYFDFDMIIQTKPTFNFRFNNKISLYASNDNLTWNLINEYEAQEQIIEINTYYRYFRFDITNVDYNTIALYYMYISNVKYKKTEYENQFTIPNDLTNIENNERVLIETPKGPSFISLGNNWTEITPTNIVNDNDVEINIDYLPDSSYPLTRIVDENNSAGMYFVKTTDLQQENNIIIDLKQLCLINSFKTKIINIDNSVELSYSNDNISYITFNTITTDQTNIEEKLTDYIKARYIKIHCNKSSSKNVTIYEISINYSIDYIMSLDLDNVASNTLNGVNIDTLLQPSTKYELIYNENTNKFEIKGVILDITLSEAVSEIALPTDLLKIGSNYIIMTNGTRSSAGSNLLMKIGGSSGIFLGNLGTTDTIATSYLCISNNGISSIDNSSSNGIRYVSNTLGEIYDSNMIITTNSSVTIGAGTRIIIKEI